MSGVALKPFRIGPVCVDLPVVLAPLAGYSDLAYRGLCRRFGVGYCTTEMILDRSVTARRRKPNPLLASEPGDHPCAAQLIGNDPDEMARAAVALEAMGFDAVDLNFACPVNKAIRRKRGGQLMSDPARAVEVTEAVIAAVDLPVTVKVRQRYALADGEGNFWTLAAGARAAGAAALAVHGRSVEQKYRGQADWEFLRRVAGEFADWTVLGSGDVLTSADALAMLEQTGVSGVLAARGALGNPWFFQQVRELAAGREPTWPSLAEQREVLREHFGRMVDLYGPERAPQLMRKTSIRYSRMHPEPKKVRMAFVATRTVGQWNDVLEMYYQGYLLDSGYPYM
jgi:tRNA-dihydrouridine synthase B